MVKHTQTMRRLFNHFVGLALKWLIDVLLIFICNSPGLIEISNPEPLLLESNALITASYTYHISLQQRRWFRKICFFFKIYKNQCPKYLFDIIPQSNCQCRIRNEHNIPHMNLKDQYSKNLYFPSIISEWNN